VEELSERLGVSKSHLVRTFTAAVGVPPGKYLVRVRIEAAMRLLLHREYSLEVIASLCGFSGANYLCRVFKKETGQTPAQWRALAARTSVAGLSSDESRREQELYV
jgi:AraC-like DNA-binding protein